jgi:hypothetical protein
MASVETVMAALVEVGRALDDDVAVYHLMPAAITTPAIVIGLPTIVGYHDLGPMVELGFRVRLFESLMGDQERTDLAAYITPTGDRSLIAAIEADATLGLVDGTKARLGGWNPFSVETVATLAYEGGELEVNVVTPREDS